MFRKIVSNLAFSPALVGQLGFYAKRLRKEEATRRIGLIFTALALVVQSFAVFSPPESANAANSSDFIRGGFTKTSEYLSHYDQNSNNLKDIFTSLGITRAEIQATKKGTINSKDVLSWGMTSRFSAAQGERTYSYSKSNGSTGTVYYRPLSLWDSKDYTKKYGSTYDAFIGYSEKFGWFALMNNCGNLITKKAPTPPKPSSACEGLSIERISRTRYQFNAQASVKNGATIKSYTYTVKDKNGKAVHTKTLPSNKTSSTYTYDQTSPGTYSASLVVDTSEGKKDGAKCQVAFTVAAPEVCAYNASLPKNSPDCQPCPGDSLIWIKDAKCEAKIIQSKTASNLSQGNKDAASLLAKPSNRIAYTVTAENTGTAPAKVKMEEKLDDVLEYATLFDNGGATFDKETKTLTWTEATLQPGQKQSRIFVIQLAEAIPAVAQGRSDRTSYDCKMTNTFGNTVDVNVDCPPAKQIESVVTELPKTGPGENAVFAAVVLAVVVYFYARSRQMKKEVRLIRRDLNAGTI